MCAPGYEGRLCDQKSKCQCSNGGKCIKQPLGHSICSCPSNFCGSHCEKKCNGQTRLEKTKVFDECDPKFCKKRGLCLVNRNDPLNFKCACKQSFTGRFCQKKKSV
ncbi:hypothetical protein SNEBB_008629 [Seison nebaliae]|nr:hypothetical protein SNEBB_008629 [Seison nebaliae]